MTSRDRLALWVLALWLAGLGLYFGGKKALNFRRNWREAQARMRQVNQLQSELEKEFRALKAERERLKEAFTKDLKDLTEDQLRLKGQAALLGAADKAGLKGVRLRNEAQRPEAPLKELRWTLEGEGTFPQWVEAFQEIEASLPLIGLQGIRLEGIGDPWGAATQALGADGPALKGGVLCSWIIFTESGEPSTPVKSVFAPPSGEGGTGRAPR